ncbi:MAG: anti-phage dCTP deaminase, partial [Myxococcota bacterium]
MATRRRQVGSGRSEIEETPARRGSGEPENPELVVGLVAAVGTPLDLVQNVLSELFAERGYSMELLHLSGYLDSFELEARKEGEGESERLDSAMNRGNEARRKTERDDILALAAIADIRSKRGEEPGPLPGRAFVLRQLKRPEEVELLRRTYGEGFVLLGVFCRRAERKRQLELKGIGPDDAEALILRDEHEVELGGQALRTTFHLADLFVEVGDSRDACSDALKRVIHLLFGLGITTPTKAEYGMFHAYAASLRSSQLGRQVGAALLSDLGDLISVGANEVPRFDGGLYWEGEKPDVRDHKRGRDSSDEAEEEIVREVLDRIDPEWNAATPGEKQRLIIGRLEKLRSTRITSLTEFGRAVHAEAEAIVSAARLGTSTLGSALYCTTFPCHVCAKHIVAAGIRSVTYIEPYPKSRALDLHEDSISLEDDDKKKVVFRPFVGVAPRAFPRLFSMTALDGSEIPRKDDEGRAIADQIHIR